MATIASLNVLLGATTGPFTKGFQGAETVATGFSKTIKGIGGVLGSAFSVATGPIGLVIGGIAGIAKSMEAAGEAAAAGKKLDAVLAATGNTTGFTSDELKGMAADLQNVTNFEDDATIAAMGSLAAFKSIGGETFKGAVTAAMDLSAVMGTDIQSSIMSVGKALESPATSFGKLRKMGIFFDEATQKNIKSLVGLGQTGAAQGIILEQMQSRFGGAALKMAKPFEIFKNKLGDTMEEIGAIFLKLRDVAAAVMLPIINVLTSGFRSIVAIVVPILSALASAVATGMAALVAFVTPIWMAFTSFIGTAFSAILDWTAPILVSYGSLFMAFVGSLIEMGQALWAGLTVIFASVSEFIGNALNAIGINMQSVGGWGTWLRDMLQGALLVIEFGFTHWKDVASLALIGVGYGVVAFANQTIHFFTVALPGYLSWFGDHWREVFLDIVNVTATMASNIWENLKSLFNGIVGLFSGEGFSFTWTPLTEGFKSAISELPQIAAREIGPLEKELHDQMVALGGQIKNDFGTFVEAKAPELAKDTEAFRAKLGEGLAGFLPAEQQAIVPKTPQLIAGSGGDGGSKVGALVRGSAEAFKAANSKSGIDALTQVAEKQLEQQQRQTAALENMESNDDEVVGIP